MSQRVYEPQDRYFKLAKKEGYRSRAAYKLKEIQNRFKVVGKGQRILDLGAAPGGFLQVAREIAGPKALLVGVDLQAIAPLPFENIELIQADILADDFISLLTARYPKPFQVILSDLAPRTTGIADVDKIRSVALGEQVLALALNLLAEGGNMVVKVLEGRDYHAFNQAAKQHFAKVKSIKPPATRPGSSEIYLIGLGFRKPLKKEPREDGQKRES